MSKLPSLLGLSGSLLVASLLLGCSEGEGDDDAAAGAAGTGGTGASGGSAGSGAGSGGSGGVIEMGPFCDPSLNLFGGIEHPNPLISVGKEVVASEGVLNPEKATDGGYHIRDGVIFGTPSEDEPAWVAIDLGEGPERLLLTWADSSSGAYTASGVTPIDFRIETSDDSSDGADGDWETVADVEANAVRSRAHAFDFEGQRWVRFVVTKATEASEGVEIDEIAIYDASDADERPEDTFLFLGDSITQGAFPRSFGTIQNFDARVTALHPEFTPAFINAGIGGELATGGLARIDQVLEANPDLRYVAIGYGTNDSWGDKNVESVGFEATMNQLVDRVIDSGAIPILARIPYATTGHGTLPSFNAVIDRIAAERGLPCGPDFYGWFQSKADEQLSSDGVHPNTTGYSNMNRLWAESVSPLYPAE